MEGKKGGKLREWGIKPGERPDIEFYQKVNQRFQEQALNSLREPARGDTHGRRDYVHLYEVDKLKTTVKQNMKIHWPAPAVNAAGNQGNGSDAAQDIR